MIITGNGIHVYRFEINPGKHEIDVAYKNILSEDEKTRADRFRFEKDKNNFIYCRTKLRNILSEYTGISSGEMVFSYTKYGKPFIEDHSIKFNVSHSGNYAVIAVTENNEIGIDIEFKREIADAKNIAVRYFSDDEMIEFLKMKDDKVKDAFFTCWTRKEAFIKAVGEGLSYPLSDFSVSFVNGSAPLIRKIYSNPDETKLWSLFNVNTEVNYVSSLAVKTDNAELIYIS